MQLLEPVPPTRSQPAVRRNLDTICLKCLEKEPRRRYKTAIAGRGFGPLPGRQAHQRPSGWPDGAGLEVARCRGGGGLSAAVLVVAVLGFTGIVWGWAEGRGWRDTARRQWYRANMAAAAAALQMHNNVAARRILDTAPAEFRQWEWHYFHSQLDNASRVLTGHQGPVVGVVFSPDGGRLASVSEDHTVRLWEAATGCEMALAREHGESLDAVAFSPDGRRLASGDGNGTVRLWDAHSGPARHMPGKWPRTGPGLQPGRHAAGLDGHAGGRSLPTLGCGHGKSARGVALAGRHPWPDLHPGRRRIVCCRNDVVSVLDATTGKEVMAQRRGQLAFLPRGEPMVDGSQRDGITPITRAASGTWAAASSWPS